MTVCPYDSLSLRQSLPVRSPRLTCVSVRLIPSGGRIESRSGSTTTTRLSFFRPQNPQLVVGLEPTRVQRRVEAEGVDGRIGITHRQLHSPSLFWMALWAKIVKKTQNRQPFYHSLSHEQGSERNERASERTSERSGAREQSK